MAKPIKVISVREAPWGPGCYVTVTKHQFMKLPNWVRDFTPYNYPNNHKHIEIRVYAKDELEAMMRFQKLWAALSVLHEEKQDA